MNLIVVEGVRGNLVDGSQTPQCQLLHRVRLTTQLRFAEENSSICIFAAPDAESVRRALRAVDCEFTQAWPTLTRRGNQQAVPNLAIVLSNDAAFDHSSRQPKYGALVEELESTGCEFVLAYPSLDRARLVALFATNNRPNVEELSETFRGDWSIENYWTIL